MENLIHRSADTVLGSHRLPLSSGETWNRTALQERALVVSALGNVGSFVPKRGGGGPTCIEGHEPSLFRAACIRAFHFLSMVCGRSSITLAGRGGS